MFSVFYLTSNLPFNSLLFCRARSICIPDIRLNRDRNSVIERFIFIPFEIFRQHRSARVVFLISIESSFSVSMMKAVENEIMLSFFLCDQFLSR